VKQKIISSREDVREFITDLKRIINDPKFDVGRDLDILQKKKQSHLLIHLLQRIQC